MANLPSPVEAINDEIFTRHQVKVWVKRDDLIHQEIMGNKWRKLKYNLSQALTAGYSGLLTFGGAYSNHIAATAAAAREHQLQAIGIIRGDELDSNANTTLRYASAQGMQLEFVSRERFRQLKNMPAELSVNYPDHYLLPEGGTNGLAIRGSAELVEELQEDFDYLVVPIGTGGTMAGIISGLKGRSTVVGISTLKGNWIEDEFAKLLRTHDIPFTNYRLIKDYHFGGYGKVTDQLIAFINRIKKKNDLQLDPIYTGKMYFGVMNLIAEGFFSIGSKILVVHTGGLQGISGYNDQAQNKILV